MIVTVSAQAAILDIDGTLVDSNYQHAIAWYRAFREFGVTLPLYRIHRHIGMGGDQLVGALAGDEFENRYGDAVRAAETRQYGELLPEVACFEDATALLTALHDAGHPLVLATSARPA
ncbi:MAG: HAD family hydrolase, partial [Candidatus Dormibacteraeota bacterium]|nr:HAD family hydrolase [Candidatus Dormibacteraeota bacterium]